MSYEVVLTDSFKKCIKTYKKRFRKVNEDVKKAIKQIIDNPALGDVIPGGYNTQKLRVKNSNLKKGKRSGYRLIYYVQDEPEPIIFLLLLYSKTDQSNVSNKELESLLKELDLPTT